MARKRANITDLLNDMTYKCVFDKYKLISVNAFEWAGLPSGIQERHIERLLFDHGRAVFFRDPDMDYMCLEVQEGGRRNVYGDSLDYRAYGVGYNRHLSADDCIIVENNKLRIPTVNFLYLYANKITEAERAMDVNVKVNKTPFIFACDDKNILSVKRMFDQIDSNTYAIYADKAFNIEDITVLQTGVKFLGAELMDYKNAVEAELLTFLGINNVNTDKKERLITDEANANNQLINSFAQLQLEARERACEAIHKKFGLNISVKLRQSQTEEAGKNAEPV